MHLRVTFDCPCGLTADVLRELTTAGESGYPFPALIADGERGRAIAVASRHESESALDRVTVVVALSNPAAALQAISDALQPLSWWPDESTTTISGLARGSDCLLGVGYVVTKDNWRDLLDTEV